MAGVKADLTAKITGLITRLADLATPRSAFDLSAQTSLTEGVGAGQADLVATDTAQIAASGTLDLDLSGALLTPLGTPCVFAKVVAILLKAKASNTNNVVIGNAASNQFVGPFGGAAHTIAVQPGGFAMLVAPNAGWTVTAGTGDILRIANGGSGTAVDFDIVIIGRSA